MLDPVMVLKNPRSPLPFDFGSFEENWEPGSSSKLTFKNQMWFQFGFYPSKLECAIVTLHTGHPPNIGTDLKPELTWNPRFQHSKLGTRPTLVWNWNLRLEPSKPGTCQHWNVPASYPERINLGRNTGDR